MGMEQIRNSQVYGDLCGGIAGGKKFKAIQSGGRVVMNGLLSGEFRP